ncbi:outer membrane usher protein LpfC [Enterobacter cloacae]|uniref:Outer membrane usher protein LpfC n=1 Tax=Enterobacter cloacae TaxID=550 RepID=A0A377M1Y0_ENTCL|nr:outer membrane usher protein LpfC [Enterobacter cloacae]
MQREGRLKYALTGGQYRAYNSSVEKTPFGQIAAIYGLQKGITIYGGGQVVPANISRLRSAPVKTWGISARFLSMSPRPGQRRPILQKRRGSPGERVYSKNVINTGTNFSIAGYRYSTRGYYGLQDVLGLLGEQRRTSGTDGVTAWSSP